MWWGKKKQPHMQSSDPVNAYVNVFFAYIRWSQECSARVWYNVFPSTFQQLLLWSACITESHSEPKVPTIRILVVHIMEV